MSSGTQVPKIPTAMEKILHLILRWHRPNTLSTRRLLCIPPFIVVQIKAKSLGWGKMFENIFDSRNKRLTITIWHDKIAMPRKALPSVDLFSNRKRLRLEQYPTVYVATPRDQTLVLSFVTNWITVYSRLNKQCDTVIVKPIITLFITPIIKGTFENSVYKTAKIENIYQTDVARIYAV